MKTSFILNSFDISTDLNPSTILLDFIRKEAHLHGTKEVCKEGDCGACTVLLGEKEKGVLKYKSITSCLVPIGDIQGKHVVTIEGLNKNDELSPIQREFLSEGASQCGFCTPGFIVSLTAYFLNSPALSYDDAINFMDGNICRCTGYGSIRRAAKTLSEVYSPKLDTGDRISQLVMWKILPEYFLDIPGRLDNVKTLDVSINKKQILIGGGTDLFVQNADSLLEKDVVFITKDKSLSYITEKDGEIKIGSNTTVSELSESKIFRKHLPSFLKSSELISSTAIRNRATIAGNFVNASPIGDLTIIFLALNSNLIISDGNKIRTLPLRKFYSAYKTFDLKENEFIKEIRLKIPVGKFNFEKVSKRTYLDIASANSAALISVNNKIIESADISAGGIGPFPLYLRKTCEFLKGKVLSASVLKESSEILLDEITPIDDVRGSAEYKALLVRQLFYGHFIILYPSIIKIEDLI